MKNALFLGILFVIPIFVLILSQTDKKESPKRRLVGYCILAFLLLVVIIAHQFSVHHVPIKVYYDEENQVVIVSPGFLYTLGGYEVRHTAKHGVEPLLPLSDSTDSEYRFRAGAGEDAFEEITIWSRCDLNGMSRTCMLEADREWKPSRGWYHYSISGLGFSYSVSFEIYPPAP